MDENLNNGVKTPTGSENPTVEKSSAKEDPNVREISPDFILGFGEMEVRNKICSLIKVEGGSTDTTCPVEEKMKSVSKTSIYEEKYIEVDSDASYDNSAETIDQLKKDFQNASEGQTVDPIKQNGFSERIAIGENVYDVGLIKCSSGVCNNTAVGKYQTIRYTWEVHDFNPLTTTTFEGVYDIPIKYKKVDINRPAKTALVDGHIQSYVNKNKITISVTLPLVGNDQEKFDEEFQDAARDIIAFGINETLKELMEMGVDKMDLAKEEIKLTSRAEIEARLRNKIVARYPDLSEEEIIASIKAIYPAVADTLEIMPLTRRSVTISIYITSIEKCLKSECNWTSTNPKWQYYSTTNHIMRYRPIANFTHSFPVTDKVYDKVQDYGEELFCGFVNFCNDTLCNIMDLDDIDGLESDLSVEESPDTVSQIIGITPKEMFGIHKEFKKTVDETIEDILTKRDKNKLSDSMKHLKG